MVDASFIAEYLVDPELLSWNPSSKALDVTKHAIEILAMANDIYTLQQIDKSHLEDMVDAKGSQIKDKEAYLSHVVNTGKIFAALTEKLLERHPNLRLPLPEIARPMGFVHDLNAAYSDYEKTGQQSKQADLYFQARHLGVELVSEHIAFHCAYLETLGVICDNEPFPKCEAYDTMRKVLQGDSSNSLTSIGNHFGPFILGMTNLPLIVLTVADYLEVGSPVFDLKSFEHNFRAKVDIKYRYYDKHVAKGEPTSALGQGLFERKGIERIKRYKNIVWDLLTGDDKKIENYHKNVPFFWCPH